MGCAGSKAAATEDKKPEENNEQKPEGEERIIVLEIFKLSSYFLSVLLKTIYFILSPFSLL